MRSHAEQGGTLQPPSASLVAFLTAAEKRVAAEERLAADRGETTIVAADRGETFTTVWTRVAPLLRAQAHVEAQRQDVRERVHGN